MEGSLYSSFKSSWSSVPVKYLNVSSRQILAENLDGKQDFLSAKRISRDYRGLAEQMRFQYHEIRSLAEFRDRTFRILDEWETRPEATVDKLINYLENMDRHDVIEELIPSIEKDVKNYEEYLKSRESPIQVSEVSSASASSLPKALTIHDLKYSEYTLYDAYLCYAKEDFNIAVQLAEILEFTNGFKLYISQRDMLTGCPELDTNIELIKNRCRRMIILLTPHFMKSPALEFQTSFARSLGIDQRERILIPVVLVPCDIPPILQNMSKVNLITEWTLDWNWDKLIASLQPESDMPEISSSLRRSPTNRWNMMPNSVHPVASENRPALTSSGSTRNILGYVSGPHTHRSITAVDTSDNDRENSASPPSSPSTSSQMLHPFIAFLRRLRNSRSNTSTTCSSDVSNKCHSI